MHQEYAVEPAAIGSSWETFRYLIEKFGFQEGRLISRFPKRWERQVLEAAKAAEVSDMAYAKIVEKLKNKKRTAIIKSGRAYGSGLDAWVANARVAHAVKPFHAIIVQDDHDDDLLVTPQNLDEKHPLMLAPTTRNVSRTPQALADACLLLLCSAREVDIVDPYFDIQTARFTDPLRTLLALAYDSEKKDLFIRIHFLTNVKRRPTVEYVRQNVHQWVDNWVPDSFELHLYEWEELPDGEDFHDRFMLCDCGGLTIGAGFSAEVEPQTTNVGLMDEKNVQELRARFAPGATVYRQSGPAIRVKSNGDAEYIDPIDQ
ncbi:MAG: hypothetical protein OXC05_14330 [Halieaceae bacterium]|nr:hypothetical protein [Halieaceae bacterium]